MFFYSCLVDGSLKTDMRIHSGKKVCLNLYPAEADFGIKFIRKDLSMQKKHIELISEIIIKNKVCKTKKCLEKNKINNDILSLIKKNSEYFNLMYKKDFSQFKKLLKYSILAQILLMFSLISEKNVFQFLETYTKLIVNEKL